ncbi:MAG TPA: kelch repeat-containing protein [Kofleriaceae bacterium]|nr:kelch repeat-containing protein [Kofleriaceae bacterium]
MRCWLVALLLLGGCLESDLVRCGDKLCPVGAFCTPEGCVLQDQIDVCRNKADGDECQVLNLPAGFCRNGTCVSAECGNALMEPGEACDDGNHDEGDGCSVDCRSLESCGNDIIDLVKSEQCDSGVPQMSGDGCTSTCQAEFDIWRDVTPQQLIGRWGAKMAFDPAHNEIVLFGGNNNGALGDTWILRGGAWEERSPASSPEARYGHAMAYLPGVGVVLFGGTTGTVYPSGTWVWNGSQWTKLNIGAGAASPHVRTGAAMALNPQTGHLMLFGGGFGGTVYADTWDFDGTTWTKLSAPDVAGMTWVSMFVDPNAAASNSGAVWIIGSDGSATGNKTLYWNVSQWVAHAPSGAPAYVDPAIAIDHNRVVLFGGRDPNTNAPTNTTFFWDSGNRNWVQQTVVGTPAARWKIAAANDGANMVMFGGLSATDSPLANTYQLTTVTGPPVTYRYTSIPTTPRPISRYGATSVYDARTGEVFIFGGFTLDNSEEGDLWRWTFPLWRTGASGPDPRMNASMTYDEAREETVLFGGVDDCGTGTGSGSGGLCGSGSGGGSGTGARVYFDDTSTLKSNMWETRTLTLKPPPRADAAIAYDPNAQVVILFGGQNATTSFDDTWKWDGTAWTKLLPATSPPPMWGGRLVYDRARSLFVLYAGTGALATDLGRVWTFDGTTWHDATPAATLAQPPARRRCVFVYNPRRQRSLLFGGVLPNGQILNDTWEWDGVAWEQRHPVQAPSPRYDAAATFDASRGHVLVFGGAGQVNALQDDVWVYNFVSNSETVERCDGMDADGDQLVDCADPDCYWRCDPYCPPGSIMCAPDRPRCGDGKPSPLETGFCAP